MIFKIDNEIFAMEGAKKNEQGLKTCRLQFCQFLFDIMQVRVTSAQCFEKKTNNNNNKIVV
jgi:hypothetical protein